MPGFYKDAGFTRPLKNFAGKSILTAQEVEDVVAYISTLKE
jgi:sulfur-oxidizing protein SoxX